MSEEIPGAVCPEPDGSEGRALRAWSGHVYRRGGNHGANPVGCMDGDADSDAVRLCDRAPP
jgi:hypothetical protein